MEAGSGYRRRVIQGSWLASVCSRRRGARIGAADKTSMARTPVISAVLVCAIGAIVGCASLPELRSIERGLELAVTAPALLDRGGTTTLQFMLTNRGKTAIDACVSSGRSVSILSDSRASRRPVAGSGTVVDHPGCTQRFHLAPSEQITWAETARIPDVSPGPASLQASVQVVSPLGCGRFGCPATTLRTSTRVSIR